MQSTNIVAETFLPASRAHVGLNVCGCFCFVDWKACQAYSTYMKGVAFRMVFPFVACRCKFSGVVYVESSFGVRARYTAEVHGIVTVLHHQCCVE